MQALGGPEEDTGGGFTHEGWAMPFVDDAASREVDETIADEFDMLSGCRTYGIFVGYWSHQEDPIAKASNEATKYVATRRGPDQLVSETCLSAARLPEEIRPLTTSDGPNCTSGAAANYRRRSSPPISSTNIASGPFRWCSAHGSADREQRATPPSLWSGPAARPGLSSSTPPTRPVLFRVRQPSPI